jgi:hypothetical protein
MTKKKQVVTAGVNARERATDAAIAWTEQEVRRNPQVQYAETLAYGKGWQAGYKEALRDAQSLVLAAKRGRR